MKNIRLEFNGKNEIVRNENEAIAFIESLGFEMNDTTSSHVASLFSEELHHDHFSYFIKGQFGNVNCLKPRGIGNDSIKFYYTVCETVEEYDEAVAARELRYAEVENEVMEISSRYIEGMKGHNEVSLNRKYSIINGDSITVYLRMECYWSNTFKSWCPIKEKTINISIDTLCDENGINIREILK